MQLKNQISEPRIKHENHSENRLVRVYYKDGDSTMLIAKNVPLCTARSMESYIKSVLERVSSKLQGHFIYTQ